MKDREGLKEELLWHYEKIMQNNSMDDIAMVSSKLGKTWTYREMIDAIKNDTVLEGSNGYNPIDKYIGDIEVEKEKESLARTVMKEVCSWLSNYAFVDDDCKVSHSLLLHDFFKNFRKYI